MTEAIVSMILLLIFGIYLFLIWGRGSHHGVKDLKRWYYAHRGLHGEGRPENSMAAFRAALEGGYGIELDVHLLADGELAVIHDSLLERTTGMPGRIEELTVQDLQNYHLEGTEETIPTFRQVLELFDGKAPLIVELKAENGNHAALTETACRMLEDYKGVYCMESFDPRCVAWLRKNRPEIIRGQPAENYFRSKNKLPFYLKFLLSNHLLNCVTRPDFVAYRFSDRRSTWSNVLCMTYITGVSWTIKSQEEFDTAVSGGWIPIFEGFRPDPTRNSEN